MDDHTLGDYLLSRVRQHGAKVAQVDAETGESLSFRQLAMRAEALSELLSECGLGPGRVALVIGENSPHYPWVLLGVLRTGAAIFALSPKSTRREIEDACCIAKPHLALISEATSQRHELSTALATELQRSLRQVLVWGGKKDQRDLTAGLSVLHRSREPPCACSIDKDVIMLIPSSGTTGLPKAVMFTQVNWIASLKYGIRYFISTDTVGGLAPYGHSLGNMLLLHSLYAGNTTVTFSQFSLNGLIRGILAHEVTAIHLVPSVLESLLRHPDVGQLVGLKRIMTGGATLSRRLQQEVQDRLPHVTLFNGYGLTESTYGPLFGVMTPRKSGSAGWEVPYMEHRIADPNTGMDVPVGTTGEICFKAPTIMKGYLNNPWETRQVIDENGWLHTGDIGFKDEDGAYFIVDRLKNVFKYNGNQVSPQQIEAVLSMHPGVLEVAVVGVPHRYGDAPLALVVRSRYTPVMEHELQDLVEAQLESHCHLRGGVRFVAALPKTSSGKIRRYRLLDRLIDENDATRTWPSVHCV